MNKLLLLGPTLNKKDPTKTGGAVVLFEHLLSELDKKNIQYLLIDTNKKNYHNTLFAYLSILLQIFIKQFRVTHISLHSSRDYLYLLPFILVLAKIFQRKVSLRKFGGEVWDTYSESSGVKRIILNYVFRNIDFLFLEMKFLVNKFVQLNHNTFWFSNVRNYPDIAIQKNSFSKRFAFMSHVKREKGIDEIVNVVQTLDESYTIDIFGVIDDEKYSQDYFNQKGVSYRGALAAHDVLPTLMKYDVLLLPSWKEGYPGIVIESYSIGKPIISTNLQGLREITDPYETGILVEPKDTDALKKAIEYFNETNYECFSKKAQEKFDLFDGEKQTIKFLKQINLY